MMEVSDNAKGLALAVASSAFIGVSFILKKGRLLRAGKGGVRAGQKMHLYYSNTVPGLGNVGISQDLLLPHGLSKDRVEGNVRIIFSSPGFVPSIKP
jgi:hypothetical protein